MQVPPTPPDRRFQRRSMDLAPEDRHLVAQHDDLDGEVHVAPADESDQLEDAAERSVEEREGHRRMLVLPDGGRQSADWRLRMGFSAPTGRRQDCATLGPRRGRG